jgi:hypothetical protein
MMLCRIVEIIAQSSLYDYSVIGMGIRTNVEGIFPTIDFSALMLQLDQMLMDQRGVRRFAHKYVEGVMSTLVSFIILCCSPFLI